MRKIHGMGLLAVLGLVNAALAQNVVVSQVYGGGGNATSVYTHDFIELRNRTSLPISLTGWSVQYASATGSTWAVTSLSGTIPANGYYLVQEAQGAGGTTPLPTPDATGTIAMSATAGKVALVQSTTALSGSCPTAGTYVDLVGFGATANCFEGSGPTPAPSNTNSVIRALAGCTDTNDNAADFAAAAAAPRNSASPAGAACSGGITDCNNNGIDDAQDILNGTSQDCNANAVPDECDITNGAPDGNGNGIPDSCETNINQIMITEIVDGPLAGGLPKYVEITNIGTTPVVFGPNDALRVYANGATTPGNSYSLNNLTLAGGESYTIANEGSGGAGAAAWLSVYGFFNPPRAYGSASFVNGDDVVTFERGATVIDTYGRIGEGAGGPTSVDWGYSDGYARRRPSVCAPSATFVVGQWVIGGNDSLEAPTPNAFPEPANWTANLRSLTNPNTHPNTCFGRVNDCNGNGTDDTQDIINGMPDCNANGVPDSCDILAGANDCNSNGVPDNCDITSGSAQDINHNGIPDSCEPILFDCNNNGVEDATDIQNGTSQDCDGNGVPDECQVGQQAFTDADGNAVSDACEGAAVQLTGVNGTVQPNGVRALPNGAAFFNIEGDGNGANASYGGIRFDVAAIKAQLDAEFGAGNWTVQRIYMHLIQSNAAFSAAGPLKIWWTNNDSIDFTPGTTTTQYGNFAADFPDRQLAADSSYTVVANGDVDSTLVYDASGSNNPGAISLANEIQGGSGLATIVISEDFDLPSPRAVAATYAGHTNNQYRGPTLVVFASVGGQCFYANCPWSQDCCPFDFNGSGGTPDDADISTFFAAWNAGDSCADVNLSEGTPDDADVSAFFAGWNAGGC